MKESVVGHPVYLRLARVVVVKETSARGLVQELVDLLNGLEGFLMEGGREREGGREGERERERKRGKIVKCVTDGNTDGRPARGQL